jgi:hypothetical protein
MRLWALFTMVVAWIMFAVLRDNLILLAVGVIVFDLDAPRCRHFKQNTSLHSGARDPDAAECRLPDCDVLRWQLDDWSASAGIGEDGQGPAGSRLGSRAHRAEVARSPLQPT